jgi:hypothetical protein
VENYYGTEQEAWALNGLEEPLKKENNALIEVVPRRKAESMPFFYSLPQPAPFRMFVMLTLKTRLHT